MIRNSLKKTQEATFAIELPHPHHDEMPTPMGTGFFISPDGWFVTAAHVVTENGNIRTDLSKAYISKETRLGDWANTVPITCKGLNLEYLDPSTDFVILKVDFKTNATKAWLKNRKEFPFIQISSRELEEGEPVYSFGYPLADPDSQNMGNITWGYSGLCPRVTSAIVSSTFEKQPMVMTDGDPKVYVLDKALNYGNSGGPIIATETGKVHAFCSRFQPVGIPQGHLLYRNGVPLVIVIPSLYGIVYRLNNPNILKELKDKNIPISSI